MENARLNQIFTQRSDSHRRLGGHLLKGRIMRPYLPACFILAFSIFSVPALAESRSATMPVSAVIQNNCIVAATPMAFTGKTVNSPTAVDGSAQINVTCTAPTAFSVEMDRGSNAAGEQRRMVSADGSYLDYTIYSDASRSKEWGTSSAAVADEMQAATSKSYTAYGRINTVDLATPSGVYQDTITVTVNF
ncbi:Csu type fimbrial protein [Pontixanthobacter aquaemixtae]|nr:spore coat U domain-containing protein [Pontixanthobacter aquaemixtae]